MRTRTGSSNTAFATTDGTAGQGNSLSQIIGLNFDSEVQCLSLIFTIACVGISGGSCSTTITYGPGSLTVEQASGSGFAAETLYTRACARGTLLTFTSSGSV